MVFLEVEIKGNVSVPRDQLDSRGGLHLRKTIIIHLIHDIARRCASKEHGCYAAINALNSIGERRGDDHTGEVIFPVSFNCITMKPCIGEILVGIVNKIQWKGVRLRCGPMEKIFLSEKKMKDYKFRKDEPMFVHVNKHTRLEKGTKVRFKVTAIKWNELNDEFRVIATIAGDYLEPIF